MRDLIIYLDNSIGYIRGGNLAHPSLGLLFRLGMPKDTERILATYPGSRYGRRFKKFSVEYFGIGIDSDELLPHDLMEGKLGGGCILFYAPNSRIRILCAWLCTVRCAETTLTFKQIWEPAFGWQNMIGGLSPGHRHRTSDFALFARATEMPIYLSRGAIIAVPERSSKGGRPLFSNTVGEKEESLQSVIEVGIGIYSRKGEVSKLDVAKACGGKFGISSGEAGCKAIDRLIKRCNPEWNWRDNILPRMKNSPQ